MSCLQHVQCCKIPLKNTEAVLLCVLSLKTIKPVVVCWLWVYWAFRMDQRQILMRRCCTPSLSYRLSSLLSAFLNHRMRDRRTSFASLSQRTHSQSHQFPTVRKIFKCISFKLSVKTTPLIQDTNSFWSRWIWPERDSGFKNVNISGFCSPIKKLKNFCFCPCSFF